MADPGMTGVPRDVLALIVNWREATRAGLVEALGHDTPKRVDRALAELLELGAVERTGKTRSVKYMPTSSGKARKARVSDSEDGTPGIVGIAQYGGTLNMEIRVRRVVDQRRREGGRTVDNTITVRKATPEELARCTTPSAPSAASPSPPARPSSTSAASPSTTRRTAVSEPEPPAPAPSTASPSIPSTPASDQPDPEAFFPDCTPECDWLAGQAFHARDCPHTPAPATDPPEEPEPAMKTTIPPSINGTGIVPTVVDFHVIPPRDQPAEMTVDAELALEMLRARYTIALIGLVEKGNTNPDVLDRIEKHLA